MTENSFTWPGRCQDDPVHDLINAYLVIDIQNSPKGTDELLEKIRLVKIGKLSSWERIGNAYTLTLLPDSIEIEEDYSGESITCKLDDFEKAVAAWKTYICA